MSVSDIETLVTNIEEKRLQHKPELLEQLANKALEDINAYVVQNGNPQILDALKARVLLLLGFSCLLTGRMEMAAQYTFDSLGIAIHQDTTLLNASVQSQLGIIFLQLADYNSALDYFEKSLSINRKLNNEEGINKSIANLGGVYSSLGDRDNAEKFYKQAELFFEQTRNYPALISVLNNLASVANTKGQYDKAMAYHEKALQLNSLATDNMGLVNTLLNIGDVCINTKQLDIGIEHFNKAWTMAKELNDPRSVAHALTGLGALHNACALSQDDYQTALEYSLKAIPISESLNDLLSLSYNYLSISKAYEGLKDFEKALKYLHLFNATQHKYKTEEARQKGIQAEYRRKIEDAERDRQVKLARFREQEKILHNVLPEEIAKRVLDGEERIADYFENVTVFFSDFKGFTTISERLTPKQLVNELHDCFTAFDKIMQKHGVEKIKTVGDAYLAVCGLPTPDPQNAETMIAAALEINEYMKTRGDKKLNIMRIGIHSGQVVAGIVGVKKFAYDIWGDTVNVAARMEQNGEPGKINISEATYEQIKGKFKTEYRGEIEAKNKGKMKMYFVLNV